MDFEGQQRLVIGGLAAAHVAIEWSWRERYSVRLVARHELEEWSEAAVRTYDHLSAEELFDVLTVELARILGV